MTDPTPATAAAIARLVEYAYSMSASWTPGSIPPTPPGFPPEYSILAYIQATDDFEGYSSNELYGFVAHSESLGQVVIAIRGTFYIIEWLIDFEISRTPFPITGSGAVEDGFFSVFSTLSFFDSNQAAFDLFQYLQSLTASRPQTSIVFAAHSLGCAIASMLAVQYGADSVAIRKAGAVYTFAAPAPGDSIFSTFYGNHAPITYRYWNPLDPVPVALQAFGFSQTAGSGIQLVPTVEQLEAYDFLSIDCNHSLRTYAWLLDSHYSLSPSCTQTLLSVTGSPDRQARLEQQLQAIRRRHARRLEMNIL